MWTWGNNDSGQLGDGTSTNKSTPVQVKNLSGVSAIAAGSNYTVAVKSDGTVWAWGYNGAGQLGSEYSIYDYAYVPKQVNNLPNITAIAAGYYHVVALARDGSLWAWGLNYHDNGTTIFYGQLGNGTTIAGSSSPVQVKNLSSVSAVAAAGYYTVAVKSDGSVWTWGCNEYGQLGNATSLSSYSTVPLQVTGISGVVSKIAASNLHVLAMKNDGSVWAWGNNEYGQLGDGTTTTRLTPVIVTGFTGTVSKIAAGSSYSIVINNDGSVWAWGSNSSGQFGNGTTTNSKTPLQVASLTNTVSTIATRGSYTVALKNDGSVSAWGSNSSGQLGNGTTTGSPNPVTVVVPSVSAPTVTTGLANTITDKSATLTGTVNARGVTANCFFEYSTSSGYGSSSFNTAATPSQISGNSSVSVTANITGLTTNKLYYFRLYTMSDGVRTNYGSSQTFRTTSDIIVPPTLSVSPTSNSVSSSAGTTTFSVSNTGAGTMAWTAAVTSGTWLRITSGSSGSNTGTISCAFDANTTTSARTGTITVTATGATGSPKAITITQAASSQPVPSLSVSPASSSVSSSAGTTTFAVSNTGTGTMNWTAAVTSGSWLRITSGGSGSNSGTINCSFDANTTTSARTGTITVTATGATGSPKAITITQAASPQPVPSLSVSPASSSVSASAGTTSFAVSNTGAGTMAWTAAVTSGGDWLSITSGSSGSNSGTITSSYTANPTASSRTGTIRVTAAGATGSPKDITVTQIGSGTGSLTVTISPAEAITAGAMWQVDGGTWQNSGATVSNLNVGTHTVRFKNVDGWASGITKTVTIQNAQNTTATETYRLVSSLSVLPTSSNVLSSAGTTTFFVSNSAVSELKLNWTAEVTSGNSWLRITDGTNIGGYGLGTSYTNTVICAFDANTSASARTGTIRVTSTGAAGSPKDVTVTQASPSENAYFIAPVPDTGQTKCYNETAEIPCPSPGQDFYGQDGNYTTINPISYTKLDANGNDLPITATSWAMIRDNVTNFIWENKTDDGSIHDKDNTYTWDDAFSVFIAGLNSAKFGGYSDWRLPTIHELISILDYSVFFAINQNYFTTSSELYWSSSTRLTHTDYGSGIYYFGGHIINHSANLVFNPYVLKSRSNFVRAVRGGQKGSSARFIINNNGTVTDTSTALMWQQTPGGELNTWKNALAYCENLNLGGYTDWRLPTHTELWSIVDLGRIPPIDTNIFPNVVLNKVVWSSSTTRLGFGMGSIADVYCISFGKDDTRIDQLYIPKKDWYALSWAVRGGQIVSLALSSASGAQGEAVTLNLSLNNAAGTNVAAISTDIDFDPAIFEAYPNGATNTKNPSAVIGAAGTAAGKSITSNLVDSNTLRVGLFSMSNTTAIGNGIIASITFHIKSTAINGSKTDLTQIPTGSDSNSNDVIITGTKGTITINSCKLGDCNCDGTVNISELQSAVNMYLNKKTVTSCCDRDGNGIVSISEVQVIVNNYIGKVVDSSVRTKRDRKIPAAQVGVEHVADGYSLNLNSNGNKIAAISIDVAYPVELADKISFSLGASAELAGKELVQSQIQPGITRIGLIDTFDNQAIDDGEILFVHVDGDSAEGDVSFKVTASDEAGSEIQVK